MSPRITRATQKRRLLALASLLESLPTSVFDYGTFGSLKNHVEKGTDALGAATACGTTACALGWAPALPAAKKLGIRLIAVDDHFMGGSGSEFTIKGRVVTPDTVSRRLFGLSDAAYSFLFHPDASLGGMQSPSSDATPGEVAAHIRRFVEVHFA